VQVIRLFLYIKEEYNDKELAHKFLAEVSSFFDTIYPKGRQVFSFFEVVSELSVSNPRNFYVGIQESRR